MFAADASAVRDTTSGQPAGFGDRVYFAGYSLFTLGNGDFRPHGLPWQLATVLSTASGLVVATLAITYILGIVSAATQKRETALVIWTMGRTPQEILTRAWNGSDLGRLDDQVRSIVPALAGLAERHLAYPMLHQFHAADPRSAIAPNIARLDEALTLARHGLRDGHGVQEATIAQVHEVVDAYLATLSVADAPRRPPGPPALAPLADAGLPTAGTGAVQAGAAEIAERRGRLRAAVVETGWSWADVDGRRDG